MHKVVIWLLGVVAVAIFLAGVVLLFPFGRELANGKVNTDPIIVVATAQPTPTMNITLVQLPPGTVKDIKDLGRFEAKSITVQQPVQLTRSDALLLGIKDVEQVQLVVTADVIATVDFDALTDDDVKPTIDGVIVSLPGAKITSIVPDIGSLLPTSHTTSLFGKARDSFVNKAIDMAMEGIYKTALEQDICRKANENAQRKIRAFIERLGVRVLKINSKNEVCS